MNKFKEGDRVIWRGESAEFLTYHASNSEKCWICLDKGSYVMGVFEKELEPEAPAQNEPKPEAPAQNEPKPEAPAQNEPKLKTGDWVIWKNKKGEFLDYTPSGKSCHIRLNSEGFRICVPVEQVQPEPEPEPQVQNEPQTFAAYCRERKILSGYNSFALNLMSEGFLTSVNSKTDIKEFLKKENLSNGDLVYFIHVLNWSIQNDRLR